jgi:hypothetical protein
MAANDWDDGWRLKVPGTGGGGSLSDGDKGDITVSSSGTVWTIDNAAKVYDVAGGSAFGPNISEIIDTICIVRDIAFAANFSGSVAYGTATGTLSSSYEIDIQDDGVSIGQLSFATNMAPTYTTTSGTAKTVAAGSILTFVGDATVASQLTSVFYTLKGNCA